MTALGNSTATTTALAQEEPIVRLAYADLVSQSTANSPHLVRLIRKAFDSQGKGILLVHSLPQHYAGLRERLLLLSNTFASLPETSKDRYVDPESRYSFGWSHGKEMMNNGVPDTLKGSFYNNAAPTLHNKWPTAERGCETFETVFVELVDELVRLGQHLARVCDGALTETADKSAVKGIERLIRESTTSKARLLHYVRCSIALVTSTLSLLTLPSSQFSPKGQTIELAAAQGGTSEGTISDEWCGTHIDHSILTALVPAIFLFHPTASDAALPLAPLIIPSPNPEAGLYIKTRDGRTVKASIPSVSLSLPFSLSVDSSS